MVNGFPSHLRTARIIQEIIAPVLASVVPEGLVTVREVEVSADRRHAKIHYTVMGADPKATHDLLMAHIGNLRTKVARGMSSKRVPQLELLQVPLENPDLPCTVS